MIDLRDLKCTCGSTHTIDHDYICDLWASQDFANEDAVWISSKDTLYTYTEHKELLTLQGKTTKEIFQLWNKMYIKTGPVNTSSDRCLVCGTELYCDTCSCTVGLCPVLEHEFEFDTYFCINCDINNTITDSNDNGFAELKAEIQALPELECVCDPQGRFSCTKCGVWKSNKDNKWYRFGTSDSNAATYKKPAVTGPPIKTPGQHSPQVGGYNPWVGGYGDYGSYGGFSKCRHYDAVVTFPNGVKVHPSSQQDRKPGDGKPVPDFGLYLASSWKPACLAYSLDWPDYGVPVWNEIAYQSIQDAYGLAEDGSFVEVGCIGGHGRTGTVIACMAVLAGVPACEAVEWVRKNYCEHAVESDKQEWWVEWFGARLYGLEPPPMPQPAKPAITATVVAPPPTSTPAPAHGIEVSVVDDPPVRLTKKERKLLRQLHRRGRRDLR
jgi:hypothetical protein